MKSLLILKPLPGHTGRRIQFIEPDKALAIKTALSDSTSLTERQERFIVASHLDLNTVDDVKVYATADSLSNWKHPVEGEAVPKTDVQIEAERYK